MKYFDDEVSMKTPPPPGFCTVCKIVRWVDGDTVDVEITRRVRVRLLGIDTDERHTKKGEEEADIARRVAPEGTPALLFIPAGKDEEGLNDILTLGRILGHLFVDGKNVAYSIAERASHD